MNLHMRIERLEHARRVQPQLVLIAPYSVLTDDQQRQAHQAQQQGREVFTINVMPRFGGAPGIAAAT